MAYDENIYAKIISGELSKQEEESLRKSGEWDEIQQILEVSSTLSLPVHDAEKGYSELRSAQNSKTGSARIKRLYILGSSIAAMMILVFGYLFLFQSSSGIHSAPYGQTAELSLKDDTEVILNAGSSLDYAGFLDDNIREVKLEGEAFFKVIPGNAFKVNTKNGSVEVLGTAFNVRAWGEALIVECYEGKVSVRSDRNKIELSAGESVVARSGEMGNVKQSSSLQPLLWKNGLSRFENEPLREVFNELERQYDVKITMPESIKYFNGAFGHDDLQKALQKICDPMGLTFSFTDEKSVIISE